MASDFNQHAVIQSDRIAARKGAAHIEHLVHTADLDNGSVVFVGEPVSGEVIAMQVEVPTTADLTVKPLHLVATSEVLYWPTMNLQNFYNKAGETIRAYQLIVGDIYKVSQSMVTGTPAVGNYVAPVNGATTLAASSSYPTTKFVGEIVGTFDFGPYREPMFTIRVRAN